MGGGSDKHPLEWKFQGEGGWGSKEKVSFVGREGMKFSGSTQLKGI